MPFGGLLSAGVGIGGSVISGLFGSHAANKAAEAQVKAATQAKDLVGNAVNDATGELTNATTTGQNTIADAGDQQKALLQPYIASGQDATGKLTQFANATPDKFSFNPSDLASDPGYAFTLAEGQKAIQRSAAAQGSLFSSGTLKSLANYTTGTANTYFNDAYNRAASTFGINRQSALDRVSTLTNLANQGYGATGTAVNATGNTASQLANLGLTSAQAKANVGLGGAQVQAGALTNMGNAQAGGTIGASNAWLNALQGGTNSLTSYLNLPKSNGSTNPTTELNTNSPWYG